METARILNEQFFIELGYDKPQCKNGRWCAFYHFIYTTAIIADLSHGGYGSRYCYHSPDDAQAAMDAWDGIGEPDGWHRAIVRGQPIRKRDEKGNIVECN